MKRALLLAFAVGLGAFAGCGKKESVTVPGLPNPLPRVYMDLGAAPVADEFRALIGFPTRDVASLEAAIQKMYDPASPSFRQYMSAGDWLTKFAPDPGDVALVRMWLEMHGMVVQRTATNRLLLEFSGTIAQFNEAFHTELHLLQHRGADPENLEAKEIYGTPADLTLPRTIADRISGVLTADLPADTVDLPPETGAGTSMPPDNLQPAFTPQQIAKVYGALDLYAEGYRGQGTTLGIVAGAAFSVTDAQTFWRSFGIDRTDPLVKSLMEPPARRFAETALDVQWVGAMAPKASVIVYEGPESKSTSLVYVFNEAIGLAEASILTDSFAHHEDSVPKRLRLQYDASAKMAAALGITVLSATGDSAKPDAPAVCPYVTAVGGTALRAELDGRVIDESAWDSSGAGASLSFPLPSWQKGIAGDKRAVADLSVNGGYPYWFFSAGTWRGWRGTSFASPVVAGLLGLVSSYRAAKGKPAIGFLNPILYTSPQVQESFRDIVTGGAPPHAAGRGWDYPTGWGAVNAHALALALP